MKVCVLDPGKVCDNCDQCNRCDLDPTKLCDNCFRCLELDAKEYAEIPIAHIYTELDQKMFDLSGEYVPDAYEHIQTATIRNVHGYRMKDGGERR